MLREARERNRVSLEEAERELKIRQKFLAALENNQRNGVLPEIYMRGFLKNYARYLGLDSTQILLTYGGKVEPQIVLPPPPPPASSFQLTAPVKTAVLTLPKPKRTPQIAQKLRPLVRPVAIFAMVVVLIGGMVGAAVKLARGAGQLSPAQATAVWAQTRVLEPGKAVAAAETPQATETPTITPTPEPTNTPTITPTPTPIIYTGVDIELVINERSWLQVHTDGRKVFEAILEAGSRKSWHGDNIVQVRAGNAGGVEAFVNGSSIGLLGEKAQVIDMEWQKEAAAATAAGAAATSMPTIAPTQTVTPTVANQ
jgi:cytoskeletal protein RodZ